MLRSSSARLSSLLKRAQPLAVLFASGRSGWRRERLDNGRSQNIADLISRGESPCIRKAKVVSKGGGDANRGNGRSEINHVPRDALGIGARKILVAARSGEFQNVAVCRADFGNMLNEGAGDCAV